MQEHQAHLAALFPNLLNLYIWGFLEIDPSFLREIKNLTNLLIYESGLTRPVDLSDKKYFKELSINNAVPTDIELNLNNCIALENINLKKCTFGKPLNLSTCEKLENFKGENSSPIDLDSLGKCE